MESAFIALDDLTDAQLNELLASGKGRTPVYPPHISALLDSVNGSESPQAFAAEWKTLNPDAENRNAVITGCRAAAKRMEVADRLVIRENPDDNLVTFVVKPHKAA